MSRRTSWALLGLVLVGALALGSRGQSGPPTEDQRVQRITSVVRCPTCRGLSAAQSDAPSAESIRDEVRRRVQEGETDAQIKGYLVSRYGEDILLQPEADGVGVLVWALPLVGGAIAVGSLVLVLRSRRVRPGRKASDADQALVQDALPVMTVSSRDELEEERDFLLGTLRDLERERDAGELSERDYQALKDDYTARAAVVLRALERGTARARPGRRDAPQPVRVRTRRSLGITIGVIVAIAALTAGTVVAFSGQREAGQPITGSLPDTPSGRMAKALQLESEGKAAEALKIYDELLKSDPRNVQALSYRGWLLKRAGLADLAMASLDQAIAIDPRFPDAHFFRGMVLYQDRKDPSGAVTEFRLFLSNNPPQEMVPLVEDVLRRAMADAGQPVP